MGVSHANNGSFKEGNPGRPKGAVNKISQKAREAVVKFVEDNIDSVQEDYKKLKSPTQRLEFLERMLIYVMPKHAAVQVQHSGELQQNIRVSWDMPKTLADALQNSPDKGSLGDKESD